MNHDTPPTPTRPGWGQSLYSGAAGAALLHAVRTRTGEDDRDALRPWAAAMVKGPIQAAPEACGLYGGAPAVAYVLSFTHTNTAARVLATLDAHLADVTRHRLKGAHARIDRGALPTLGEYDLISGLTGLGVYHLHRGHRTELRDTLAYLVRLTEPITIEAQVLPGWWTGDSHDLRPSPRWPGGHLNFGLAHGISGPLALLATAMRHGHTVPGQRHRPDLRPARPVARRHWLARLVAGPDHPSRTPARRSPAPRPWPPVLVLRHPRHCPRPTTCRSRSRRPRLATPGRTGPGWMSGRRSAARPAHRRVSLPRVGGLTQTVSRAAADAVDDELAGHLPRLRARLDEHLDHSGLPDGVGLMDGTSGIHLVRLTEPVNTAITAPWDRCLLVAG